MAQIQTKAQEEKQQKILRALLQEPGNKKCFDCNMKGPVYANLTHSTFVCTTCSGIHREFNHRVKSISMATFKPEEIELLKRGGNDAARRRWLARWTPDDFPEPDTTDQARIRQFMRLKYIDRRWFREDGGVSAPSVSDSAPSKSAPSRSQPETRSPHSSVEPLTSLLGNNIPPISFNGNSATSSIGSSTASRGAPPPIAKPSQSGNSLVDWDKPPASSVTGNTLLDDLFTPPSAEQQAQHQLQLQQAAAAQAAQAQAQAQAQQQFQHASIMAQFAQSNPMMSQQQAWMMNMMQQQQQQQGGYNTMMPPQNMQGLGGYPQGYPQQPVSGIQSLPTQPTQPLFGGNPSSFGNGGLLGFGGAPSIQPTQPSLQPTQPTQPVQPQLQQQPVQQVPPKDDIFAALSPLSAKPQQQQQQNSGFGLAPMQPQNNQPLRPNNATPTPPSNNNPFGANNDPFGFSSPSPITPQQQQQQQTSPMLPTPNNNNNPFGANNNNNNNNNPFGLNSGPQPQPSSQFGFPQPQSNQPSVVPSTTAPSGLGSFGAGGFPSFSTAPSTQPSNNANLGSFGSQPSNNNNPFGLNSGPQPQPSSQFGFPQPTQPQQNSQFGFGGAQNPQSQFAQPQSNPSGFPNSQFGFSGQPTQPQQPQQFGFPQQTQPQQPQQFGFPGQNAQQPSQPQQQFGFPSQQPPPQNQQFGFSNQPQTPLNPFF